MIKVKKIHKDAVLPIRATSGSSGLDLTAVEIEKIEIIGEYKYVYYNTGISIEVPYGYEFQLFERSGHGFNKHIKLYSGKIDSDYRGLVKICLGMPVTTEHPKEFERVCQGSVYKVLMDECEWSDELSDTVRASNGFGHSTSGYLSTSHNDMIKVYNDNKDLMKSLAVHESSNKSNCVSLQVGKCYKTRVGEKARVVSYNPLDIQPYAVVLVDNPKYQREYYENGSFSVSQKISDLDLVEEYIED